MARLRAECPWDAKQTHSSLAPYLLEETYEALEALEHDDLGALCEELGDVLLQVFFHAAIAAERTDGTGFSIDDVANGIASKLIRRHPHVFSDVSVSGSDEVKQNWDAIKAAEREAAGTSASVLAGVPFGQPALALAAALQRRAARAGVPADLADLSDHSYLSGLSDHSDLSGPSDPSDPSDLSAGGVSETGAELFALAAKSVAAGLDPELELRAAARVYLARVQAWEQTRDT
jgi:XTP/dITP diphosphohydrolase